MHTSSSYGQPLFWNKAKCMQCVSWRSIVYIIDHSHTDIHVNKPICTGPYIVLSQRTPLKQKAYALSVPQTFKLKPHPQMEDMIHFSCLCFSLLEGWCLKGLSLLLITT